MFLNCGAFVEIYSDLLATYLCNDLSKTFANVLQITKFYKNHKKNSSTPELGKLRATYRSFFCFLPIFSGKIVDLRKCSALWGQLEPTLSEKGNCVRKVECHWSRLHGKKLFLRH